MPIIRLDGFHSSKTKAHADFDFPITVLQNSRSGAFSIKYGKQLAEGLTYAEAAKHLGESIMHALTCADQIDNTF